MIHPVRPRFTGAVGPDVGAQLSASLEISLFHACPAQASDLMFWSVVSPGPVMPHCLAGAGARTGQCLANWTCVGCTTFGSTASPPTVSCSP